MGAAGIQMACLEELGGELGALERRRQTVRLQQVQDLPPRTVGEAEGLSDCGHREADRGRGVHRTAERERAHLGRGRVGRQVGREPKCAGRREAEAS